MKSWVDMPLEQWIYVVEAPLHIHPWSVVVGNCTRAMFSTREEAVALQTRLIEAFNEQTD